MNLRIAHRLILLLLVVTALALSGCEVTSHRVIQQGFQAEGDRVKFLYEEIPGYERGILECHVAEDGELYDCREIPIVFNYGEEEQ